MHDSTTPPARPRFWPYAALAALGGASIEFVGVLYVWDILSILLCVGLISSRFGRECLVKEWALLFSLVVFCTTFVALDLINEVSLVDLARGAARNIIFVMNVFIGICGSRKFGPQKIVFALCVLALSYPIAFQSGVSISLRGETELGIPNFFKYYNGIYIVPVVLWFVRGSQVALAIALLGFSVLFATIADYRSAAGFAVFSLVGLTLAKLKGAQRLVAILIVFAVGFLVERTVRAIFVSERFFDETSIARREASDAQRADLIEFTMGKVYARPFSGYGSWTNANDFMGLTGGMMIGVHSMILQLAYEYGVLGVLFCVLISFHLITATGSNWLVDRRELFWFICTFYFILAGNAFNMVAGGFNGYNRFMLGGFLAICMTIKDQSVAPFTQVKRIRSTP